MYNKFVLQTKFVEFAAHNLQLNLRMKMRERQTLSHKTNWYDVWNITLDVLPKK